MKQGKSRKQERMVGWAREFFFNVFYTFKKLSYVVIRSFTEIVLTMCQALF